jgi:hypothetical protein
MSPREIQPRDGRPSFTVFEIFDDQGNTWRAREDLYNRATHWFGQRVVATTRTEQRGNFTNLYVDQMEPAGAQPVQQPIQQAQQAQTVPPQQVNTPTVATGVGQPTVSEWQRQTQRSIHRQTAAKVAAKMSETPAEFWENARLIYQWFELDRIPTEAEVSSVPTGPGRQNVQAYEPFTPDPGPQEGQTQSLQYGELPPEY